MTSLPASSSPLPLTAARALAYADEKLGGALRLLDRVAPTERSGAPVVDNATLPARVREAWDECHPVMASDLPDAATGKVLAKVRSWVGLLGHVRGEAARLAVAKQAERCLRDLALRVRATRKRDDRARRKARRRGRRRAVMEGR